MDLDGPWINLMSSLGVSCSATESGGVKASTTSPWCPLLWDLLLSSSGGPYSLKVQGYQHWSAEFEISRHTGLCDSQASLSL